MKPSYRLSLALLTLALGAGCDNDWRLVDRVLEPGEIDGFVGVQVEPEGPARFVETWAEEGAAHLTIVQPHGDGEVAMRLFFPLGLDVVLDGDRAQVEASVLFRDAEGEWVTHSPPEAIEVEVRPGAMSLQRTVWVERDTLQVTAMWASREHWLRASFEYVRRFTRRPPSRFRGDGDSI